MTATDTPLEDGWIAWHGGECPVAAKALVEVKLVAGSTVRRREGCDYAAHFDSLGWWEGMRDSFPIIWRICAYREVDPTR